MHLVKMTREINFKKKISIKKGDKNILKDGTESVITVQEDQDVYIDLKGSELKKAEDEYKKEKKKNIQAKIDSYKLAQENQLKNGGVGPVADCEIMQIVNEHNSNFDIIFDNQAQRRAIYEKDFNNDFNGNTHGL